MTRLHAALLMAATPLLAACGSSVPDTFEYRLFSMGTTVDIVVAGSDGPADDIVDATIEPMLRRFEVDYYAWADGELAAVNRALAAGRSIEVSGDMARLLAAAKRLSAASQGAFDPGVGGLVELWGFHRDVDAASTPPDPERISGLVAESGGIADLIVDERRVGATSSSILLDLGGIAKGLAVDRIVDLLRGGGVANALVNAGGDLRVIGAAPGREWRVGIQSPRTDGLVGAVQLDSGEAAFTSGDYERAYERAGERWHHLLDPGTGYPATHTQAVTVIAADGLTADAAATAIFVAGPDRWPAVAAALGVDLVLRVDARGHIEVTPKMRDRLQVSAGAASDIITVRN